MRLTEGELGAIQTAFVEFQSLHGVGGHIYLFGSRTKINRRGGDIDLLWLGPSSQLDKIRRHKFDIIARIQLLSEPQKIDLTLVADETKDEDPFFLTIRDDLIKLA